MISLNTYCQVKSDSIVVYSNKGIKLKVVKKNDDLEKILNKLSSSRKESRFTLYKYYKKRLIIGDVIKRKNPKKK